jgi:hypothetical protein
MKTISDQEYEEYLSLKNWISKQEILDSAKSITRLEDDIDAPVKKCVAMLALLGCEPVYSCCGFDYDGQPLHKSHQYGRPYFILTMSEKTVAFLDFLVRKKSTWYAVGGNHPKWTNVELMVGMNPHWRKEECIHFYEESLVGILQMEKILIGLHSYMAESVELVDTNYKAKTQAKHWQYPPKEPWHIKKELLNTY